MAKFVSHPGKRWDLLVYFIAYFCIFLSARSCFGQLYAGRCVDLSRINPPERAGQRLSHATLASKALSSQAQLFVSA